MQRAVRLLVLMVVLAAVILTSYHVGYYSAAAKMAAPLDTAAAVPSGTPAGEPRQRLDTFWEVWNLVEREFYNRDAIDDQKMIYGAIKGMLESLGDAHTSFANPSHARLSEEDMRGSFEGIGVTVEMKDKRLTVVAPLEDSPGERAGLRPGDVIAKVDEKDTSSLSILEAVALIRGPRGTTVRLEVERAGEPQPLLFEVIRAEIKMVTVRGQMMDGNVAYVKINQFSETTNRLLQQKLRELLANNPAALIVDLRNNPGGLLGSAVDVSSQFIADGVVLHEQRRDAPLETLNARRGGLATRVPLVVLINKASASASEIVAGALQDRGRAVLVGERSFGKDTVQNVHTLGDKSSVRITIAKWFTPNKQEIADKGLTPDIEVRLTEDDVKAGRDPQLERALDKARTGN